MLKLTIVLYVEVIDQVVLNNFSHGWLLKFHDINVAALSV